MEGDTDWHITVTPPSPKKSKRAHPLPSPYELPVLMSPPLTWDQRVLRMIRFYRIEALADALYDPEAERYFTKGNMTVRVAVRDLLIDMFNSYDTRYEDVFDMDKYTPWKKIIARALTRDLLCPEEVGCRVAMVALFSWHTIGYHSWFQDELRTSPRWYMSFEPDMLFNDRTIVEWAYIKNNLFVLDWCWTLNGCRSNPYRWFSDGYWYAPVPAKEVSLSTRLWWGSRGLYEGDDATYNFDPRRQKSVVSQAT